MKKPRRGERNAATETLSGGLIFLCATLTSRDPMPQSLDALLNSLEATKSWFGPEAAAKTQKLLDQLSRHEFSDAKSLLRFHEALLFLRALPHSKSVVAQAEKILNTFHQHIEKLGQQGADMSVFDDFDTSGVAGTVMKDTLN